MAEFRVDDRVRCVNDCDSGGDLAAGQQYTIARVYETHVALAGIAFSWSASRFELVEDGPSASPVEPSASSRMAELILGMTYTELMGVSRSFQSMQEDFPRNLTDSREWAEMLSSWAQGEGEES